jgi:endonuclease/exonuclease/phosphatase family metal-dependent hydrolase
MGLAAAVFSIMSSIPAHSSTFKLVSFNLYNRPWERSARLESAGLTLRDLDADVVALQEVATGWILPGDPVKIFSERLKMSAVHAWHERNLGIFKTGLAVLSRFPIISSEYHEFARHDFWDAKGYMSVKLALPDGRFLQLINLHMASTKHEDVRQSEWEELAAFAKGLAAQGPVLITGDFNTEPSDPSFKSFVASTGVKGLYDGRDDVEKLRSWTPDYRDSCLAMSKDSALLDHVFILSNHAPAPRFGTGRIVLPQHLPHPSDHCPVFTEVYW